MDFWLDMTIRSTRKTISHVAVCSDGHDKPFGSKAITIIDNFKKALTIPIINESHFLKRYR